MFLRVFIGLVRFWLDLAIDQKGEASGVFVRQVVLFIYSLTMVLLKGNCLFLSFPKCLLENISDFFLIS